ncbi:MAG: dicarboxylate/amino acid:cation symporter [Leptospirales bacterium]
MNKKSNQILLIGIMVGVAAGVIGGIYFADTMKQLSFLGKIFLSTLKIIAVPLVVLSMISGINSLGNIRKVGTFGGKTILYYMVTTAIAVTIGLILVNIIEPGGSSVAPDLEVPDIVKAKEAFTFMDIIKGFSPVNLFYSLVRGDLLAIIILSLVTGAVLSTIEKAKPFLKIIDNLNEYVLKVVQLILWFTPIGVFGLIGAKVAQVGAENLMSELSKLFMYFWTVVGGLFIHGVIVLPVIFYIFTKRNPLVYAKNALPALLTAFSSASSTGTLPVTIECAEKNNNISPKSAGFVLPLGATVNMDGTALYEAVAAIFIAQVFNVELTFSDQIIIFLTATLAAIGAAGIPEAGLVTMVIVLNAVGLPLEGTAMLLSIDWFLDRFRTTVNVWGDSVGAAVLEKHVIKEHEQ